MNSPTDADVAKIADLILETLGLDPTNPQPENAPDDWEDDITDFEDAIHNAIFTRISFAETTQDMEGN